MNSPADLEGAADATHVCNRRRFLQAGIGSGLLTVLAACAASSEGTAPAVAPAQLLWSEEFDKLDLVSDTNPHGRWRANDVWQPVDQGYPDFGSTGGSWCLNPNQLLAGAYRSPFTVRDSVLTITSVRTPEAWKRDIAEASGGPVPGWCGGILISNTNRADMTFNLGYYEFRARWPVPGKGMFPALWFYAAHAKTVGEEKTAEIDVLEIFGAASGRHWQATLHTRDSAGSAASVVVHQGNDDTAGWHTYGLDWTESHLGFYRDGIRVAQVTGAHAAFFATCQMSIRLNYAMNAGYFGADRTSDGSDPATLVMQVDYIRKFDHPPTTERPS